VRRSIFKIILLSILLYQINLGCSAFCLIKKDNYSYLCKNFDWPIGYGHIIVNKIGIEKLSRLSDDTKSFSWVSKYGSITFNQFGKDFPLGGMNEAGLIIEELNYHPTEYFTHPTKNLCEFQWIQFQLDNYSTVGEVINNLTKIGINQLMLGLHFITCDKYGNVAVIEFLEGEPKVFTKNTLEFPILSNNSYQNSIKYLKQFEGFGGSEKVRVRKGSQERFVRMANLMNNIIETNNNLITDKAFEILDAVKQEDTQWSIIYDNKNLEIIFKTISEKVHRKIKLDEFDFVAREILFSEITLNHNIEQQTKVNFNPYQKSYNDLLVETILAKMINYHLINCENLKILRLFFKLVE
jgi:choloylglycine hydrolase